jgi:hypothetical protein
MYILSCHFKNFFYYIANIDAESISQIKLLIHRVIGNRMCSQQINSIIKANTLKMVTIENIRIYFGRNNLYSIIEFY